MSDQAAMGNRIALATLDSTVVVSMVGAGLVKLPARFGAATRLLRAIIARSIAGTGTNMLTRLFQALAKRRPEIDAGDVADAKAAFLAGFRYAIHMPAKPLGMHDLVTGPLAQPEARPWIPYTPNIKHEVASGFSTRCAAISKAFRTANRPARADETLPAAAISSSELGRGRCGGRYMTCPIARDDRIEPAH